MQKNLLMDLFERQNSLKKIFALGKDILIEDTSLAIKFFQFNSQYRQAAESQSLYTEDLGQDVMIAENQQFTYPVFYKRGESKSNKAILLLHGLNERSWDKYLPWAEFLVQYTSRPVILFPIAFHINRSLASWLNIRNLFNLLPLRRKKTENDEILSVANLTLSQRLSDNPIRFFLSGKQSLEDITALLTVIKSNRHPLFSKDCQVDIFAYSIGAFLAQIILMVNQNDYFSKAKAFFFCGGSTFSLMNGVSKNIMDKACYQTLYDFYLKSHWSEEIKHKNDAILQAFSMMTDQNYQPQERYCFFENMKNRLKIISLIKDQVIKYEGIQAALGRKTALACVTEKDYPYHYIHEYPFPVNQMSLKNIVNQCFNETFTIIGDFFNKETN